MTNHFRFDLNLIKRLAIVYADDAADHKCSRTSMCGHISHYLLAMRISNRSIKADNLCSTTSIGAPTSIKCYVATDVFPALEIRFLCVFIKSANGLVSTNTIHASPYPIQSNA